MFRLKPKTIGEVLSRFLRDEGLETPLLQKRVIDAWDEVTGDFVARHTENKFIKNQTLIVKISSPALRADLSMQRTKIAEALNKRVGAFVISDIRIY